MAFEGYVDFASPTEVRGWIYDNALGDAPVTLEVLRGGSPIATIVADGFRDDLKAADKGNGKHAFAYQCEPNGSVAVLSARVAGKAWLIPDGGPQPTHAPPRFLRGMCHSVEYGWPSAAGGFTTAPDPKDAEPTVERLLAAFRRATRDDPASRFSRTRDIWFALGQKCHADLVDLLRTGDVPGLAAYLCDAHAHGITEGITQGARATPAIKARPEVQKLEVGRYCDYLASLAEFLGILDVESPEQHGRWAENIHEPVDRLVDLISTQLGTPIVPPERIGSLFGLRTQHGILSARDLLALYAAVRLREVAAEAGVHRPTICEIGAGLGGVAYYSHLLGAARYAIVDLPIINLLHGFYLIRSLPNATVRLYGETGDAEPDISIHPTWDFGTPATRADFLFNSDSMPEMHRKYALAYLRQAPAVIRHGLLSINQEARAPQYGQETQPPARDLAAEAGGLRRVSRNRHWLRPDYVDEYFALGDVPPNRVAPAGVHAVTPRSRVPILARLAQLIGR